MAKFGYYTVDPSQSYQDSSIFERIEGQLRIDSFKDDIQNTGGRPWPFDCLDLNPLAKKGVHHFYSKERHSALHESFCHKLYDEVVDSKDHCFRLDSVFAQTVQCNFVEFDNPRKVVAEACHLLHRLPSSPLDLPDLPLIHDSPSAFNGSSNGQVCWHDLQVVSYLSTNVIRVALMVAMYGPGTSQTLVRQSINRTAELLSTASRLAGLSISDREKENWFLVRAFLWTSWQRSSMLFFYSVLYGDIEQGFDDYAGHERVLQGFHPVPGMSIQEMSKRFAARAKPVYMCGWAFELIRADACAIGLDFRKFFERFSAAFTDRDGRCIPGQRASCKGDQPDSCQRFRGMKIENQSAHQTDCSGNCKRLTWNRASYISVSGARAVALDNRDSQECLQYCQASDRTLAISHVWSHGQGGRPEMGHGLNCCLHQRYTAIAKSFGCDSYWMDTPCIPNDHKLRREAILKIDEIFENSKVTLICDRDLMSIDASELTVESCETILVIVMVCDWNLRAWTFLEAVRGRRSVYILCKNQKIVSLGAVATKVYRQGNIDIALLLLTTPHLLPVRFGRGYAHLGDVTDSGFMTLETGGSLLSHREASRPGDDMVIWSLLLDDKVYKNAKSFWKGRIGGVVNTSFLFSSAPRLKLRGFKWAPSSPTTDLLTDRSNGSKYRLLAIDGSDSIAGMITNDGFRATWLMYDFTGGLEGSNILSTMMKVDLEPPEPNCQKNLNYVRQKYLRGYLWGALLRPIAAQSFDDPVVHRSDAGRTLLAVCATNNRCMSLKRDGLRLAMDRRIFWTWRGIHEWDMAEPLPTFSMIENIHLV